MANMDKSIGPKNSTAATSRTNGTKSFEQLTKKQLIELLEGNITQPLTPEGLYRCAVSALGKWCDDVIKGSYASMYELTTKLEALQSIYRQR
jgi:hypothetical protein